MTDSVDGGKTETQELEITNCYFKRIKWTWRTLYHFSKAVYCDLW